MRGWGWGEGRARASLFLFTMERAGDIRPHNRALMIRDKPDVNLFACLQTRFHHDSHDWEGHGLQSFPVNLSDSGSAGEAARSTQHA